MCPRPPISTPVTDIPSPELASFFSLAVPQEETDIPPGTETWLLCPYSYLPLILSSFLDFGASHALAQRPNSCASTPLPRESELAHSICTPQQVQPRTTSAPLVPKLEDASKMERDGWRGGGDGFSSGMRKL